MHVLKDDRWLNANIAGAIDPIKAVQTKKNNGTTNKGKKFPNRKRPSNTDKMRKPKSEEHKAKLCKPKSEEHKAKLCKPKSEEHKAALRGPHKPMSEEQRALRRGPKTVEAAIKSWKTRRKNKLKELDPIIQDIIINSN